mgnify:FL=1
MLRGRGDYDYCRVPGTRQLSPLEDNSKSEPKKLEKFKSINMIKQKAVIGFLGMLSPNMASVLC